MDPEIKRLLNTLRSRPETVLISQWLCGKIVEHIDGLQERLDIADQEIAHGHATCAELRTMLTNAKAERAQFAREVDEASETIAELKQQLATAEANTLDREADLIHTAPDASGLAWSKSERGIFANIASMMKSRAALARAKAGK